VGFTNLSQDHLDFHADLGDYFAAKARLFDEGRARVAVVNVDVVVIAERPKLTGYLDAMRRNLADVLRLRAADVSIKGKTNEGVGELGRGEAIAVHAVALLTSRIP